MSQDSRAVVFLKLFTVNWSISFFSNKHNSEGYQKNKTSQINFGLTKKETKNVHVCVEFTRAAEESRINTTPLHRHQ